MTKQFSYPRFFHEICNHDDDEDVLLPDHSPERLKGVFQRSLSADVCVALLEAVDEVRVDVVGALLLTRNWQQSDASVIV